jgi:hypothetical protein
MKIARPTLIRSTGSTLGKGTRPHPPALDRGEDGFPFYHPPGFSRVTHSTFVIVDRL